MGSRGEVAATEAILDRLVPLLVDRYGSAGAAAEVADAVAPASDHVAGVAASPLGPAVAPVDVGGAHEDQRKERENDQGHRQVVPPLGTQLIKTSAVRQQIVRYVDNAAA